MFVNLGDKNDIQDYNDVIMVDQEEKNDMQSKLKSAVNECKFSLDGELKQTSLCTESVQHMEAKQKVMKQGQRVPEAEAGELQTRLLMSLHIPAPANRFRNFGRHGSSSPPQNPCPFFPIKLFCHNS